MGQAGRGTAGTRSVLESHEGPWSGPANTNATQTVRHWARSGTGHARAAKALAVLHGSRKLPTVLALPGTHSLPTDDEVVLITVEVAQSGLRRVEDGAAHRERSCRA
jgi:hypothetical protein